MSLVPVLHGLAATALAAVVFSIWLAIGTLAPVRLSNDDPAAVPIAILIGSGITGFSLAVFSLFGLVDAGVIIVSTLGITSLALRARRVVTLCRACFAPLRSTIASRLLAGSIIALGLTAWISAIAPPRSADAMRYHLAHIRLLVLEGAWSPIQDFHYALPFGWTLSFLPFEMLGLPQGAQLLSLGLYAVICATTVGAVQRQNGNHLGIATALLLLFHPFVVRTFTEASADPYALFVVHALCLLLMRGKALGGREAAAFGFAAFIGLQSRYQLVAIGLAAVAVFAALHHGARDRRAYLGAIAGAAAAVVLASPFYLANASWFGNPVWPLLISEASASVSFSDLVARYYARSHTGPHDPAYMLSSLWQMVTWRQLVPVSMTIVVTIVAATRTRDVRRYLAWLGLGFLVLWLAMQPRLYPRFVLIVLPVSVLIAAITVSGWRWSARVRQGVAAAFLLAAVGANAAFSQDSLRYAATGNLARFHQHTWYYPVYSWANYNLPRDARVLTVVTSAMTYYLDRPNRHADPWVGGELDWPSLKDSEALHRRLLRDGYSHVIYEVRDWSWVAGGAEMTALMTDALRTGRLRGVRSFDVRLYNSRAARTYRTARVVVLEVAPGERPEAFRSASIASATSR